MTHQQVGVAGSTASWSAWGRDSAPCAPSLSDEAVVLRSSLTPSAYWLRYSYFIDTWIHCKSSHKVSTTQVRGVFAPWHSLDNHYSWYHAHLSLVITGTCIQTSYMTPSLVRPVILQFCNQIVYIKHKRSPIIAKIAKLKAYLKNAIYKKICF